MVVDVGEADVDGRVVQQLAREFLLVRHEEPHCAIVVELLARHRPARQLAVFVAGGDALVQQALGRVALDDDLAFLAVAEQADFLIQADALLAAAGVRAVAVEAVFGQDRADVVVEPHRFPGPGGRGRE